MFWHVLQGQQNFEHENQGQFTEYINYFFTHFVSVYEQV